MWKEDSKIDEECMLLSFACFLLKMFSVSDWKDIWHIIGIDTIMAPSFARREFLFSKNGWLVQLDFKI